MTGSVRAKWFQSIMGGNIFKLLEKPASVDDRKHWGTQERRKNKSEVRFGGTRNELRRGSYKGHAVTVSPNGPESNMSKQMSPQHASQSPFAIVTYASYNTSNNASSSDDSSIRHPF